MSPGRNLFGGLLLSSAAALAGCGSYVLQGRAIQGLTSDMAFVASDDRRLDESGVDNLRITVQRDPGTLAAQDVAAGLSDLSGRFSIPLDAFGAGWMDEQWRISASKPGFRSADSVLRLAPKKANMQLLIILAPGFSEDPREEDLMEDYERFR